MFQAQPGTFDTGAEDQLAWEEIRYDDILASMQAEELAASQLTQPSPVLTQPLQLAVSERPRPAECHRPAVERHRMLQARRRRP
jgi:hypothetical protein